MIIKEKPTTDNKFFFYGSLRQGDYNNRILGNSKPIKTADLYGYNLYSLGAYPCISKTNNMNKKVIGEIYNITDENVISAIDSMELGAGYDREIVTVIDENNKKYDVVVYTMNSYKNDDSIVENGDWIEYKKNK